MSSFLRKAIEDTEGTPVVIAGPLSSLYTEALNKIYSKDVARVSETDQADSIAVSTKSSNELGKVALPSKLSTESQAILNAMVQAAASKMPETIGEIQDDTIIYAVNQSDIDEQDVVDVAKELNENEDANFIFVTDMTNFDESSDTQAQTYLTNITPVAKALEEMVLKKGKKVCHSFEELLVALR